MLRKISRLFVIKTRFEAFLIIYALALGATTRGAHYLDAVSRAGAASCCSSPAPARCSWPAPRSSTACSYERAAKANADA